MLWQAEIYQIRDIDLIKELKKYDAAKATIGEALKDIEAEQQKELEKSQQSLQTKKVEELIESAPVAKNVDVIIENAIEGDASDIHIEPKRETSLIRFRIDGVMHNIHVIPKPLHAPIVSRIKMLSRMDLAGSVCGCENVVNHAVLDAAGQVHLLALGKDGALGALEGEVNGQQRRVADQMRHALQTPLGRCTCVRVGMQSALIQ